MSTIPERLRRIVSEGTESEFSTACLAQEAADRIDELESEIRRLRAWIMRTSSDDNLRHRAGYHGRRVMLEAASVLNGHTIPKPMGGD